MTTEKIKKKYVQVTVEFSPQGRMIPVCVTWDDGRKFEIDRVLRCERAASRKAGGVGIRYTIVVSGKETVLFYEENYRWFVEARVAG